MADVMDALVLLTDQINTLDSRGCPNPILNIFIEKRFEVFKKIANMDIPQEHIMFMPVIPRAYMGVYGLMNMVKGIGSGQTGYTYLNPFGLKDNVEVPELPYFIYNVNVKETVANRIKKLAKGKNCFELTFDEGVAVCVHSNALLERSILCFPETFYLIKSQIPCIRMDGNGCPYLDCLLPDSLDLEQDTTVFPSCEFRG